VGRILQGRYDRLLRRTTAQVGFGSKVTEALEDLFPTLDVESLPMELLRASGWHFGSGVVDRTSAVATTNVQQLFNPPGSGLLMTITSLFINVGTLGSVSWGPGFVALADASVPGAERDLRALSIAPTVGLLQREDNGTPSTFGRTVIPASTTLQIVDPNGVAVLAPGTGWLVSTLGTNVNMKTSWQWRERVAEPEELNF